jgi:hypothetical protein
MPQTLGTGYAAWIGAVLSVSKATRFNSELCEASGLTQVLMSNVTLSLGHNWTQQTYLAIAILFYIVIFSNSYTILYSHI